MFPNTCSFTSIILISYSIALKAEVYSRIHNTNASSIGGLVHKYNFLFTHATIRIGCVFVLKYWMLSEWLVGISTFCKKHCFAVCVTKEKI